jgi:hypothetical protein
MPLRDLAKKAGCWLGGHLFEGLLDALCEWLVLAQRFSRRSTA